MSFHLPGNNDRVSHIKRQTTQTIERESGMEEPEDQEKFYVAVPEKSKAGMPVLLWVLRNAPKDAKIVITHVYIFDQMIPGPLGGRVHPNIASELELVAYRQEEKGKAAKKLDDYTKQCSKAQFKWETLVFGSNDIAKGILELISLKGVKKLIMGAAEDRRYSMRMIEPTSSKAKYVKKSADPSCKIWFVCNGNLIYTREANRGNSIKSPLQCSCGLSQAGTQEQYTHNYSWTSGSSPGTSYRISDTGSLLSASMTEVDAASCADIELKDALADLTIAVQKVEESISRRKQRMEHEVESLKAELNEKDKFLKEANKQNQALEHRVKQLEETLASVNSSKLETSS